LKAAVQVIYGEYVKFAHHNEILVAITQRVISTSIHNNEGKVADIGISGKAKVPKCKNCNLQHHYSQH
jgi:hypothetical protein